MDTQTLLLVITLGTQVLASVLNTMVSNEAKVFGIPIGKVINAVALGFGKAKPGAQ